MVIPFKIKLENKLTDDEKGNFRIIKTRAFGFS
jgi:hypothetical protein